MLWLPFGSPPKVKPEDGKAVVRRVSELGEYEVIRDGLHRLEVHQSPIMGYLDRLGFELNKLSEEGFWPERSLRFGAVIAYLSYLESGYYQEIDDDMFSLGFELALMDGIPDSYTSSYYADNTLQHTLEEVRVACNMPSGEGIDQISSMGAGVMRFYMQHALAA
jgi:hypothetical protein